MAEKSLRYDCLPDAIPYILEDDWGVSCKNDMEKDLVIRAYTWRYGFNKNEADRLQQWFVSEGSLAQWGGFTGRVSFVLNKKDLTLMRIFISLLILLSAEDHLHRFLSIADIFNLAVRVSVFSDYTRCVFSEIVRLADNRTNRMLSKEAIYNALLSERACEHSDSFECTCFQEKTCILNKSCIDEAIKKLCCNNAICFDEGVHMYYLQ